jgi:hypothetical protein
MENATTEDQFSAFVTRSQSAATDPLPEYTVTVTAKVGDDLASFETTLRAKPATAAMRSAMCRIPVAAQDDIRTIEVSEPRTHE